MYTYNSIHPALFDELGLLTFYPSHGEPLQRCPDQRILLTDHKAFPCYKAEIL